MKWKARLTLLRKEFFSKKHWLLLSIVTTFLVLFSIGFISFFELSLIHILFYLSFTIICFSTYALMITDSRGYSYTWTSVDHNQYWKSYNTMTTTYYSRDRHGIQNHPGSNSYQID